MLWYSPLHSIHHLPQVLDCFSTATLQLNSQKGIFAARQIKILCHLVSADGIHPGPLKIQVVSDFPQPNVQKHVCVFLGLCTYFQRFIPGFSHTAEPLNKLLWNNTKFEWGPTLVKAFQSLKLALTSVSVLGHFLPGASTELRTGASGHGLGAVLAQTVHGTERVIAYTSHTLTKSERNYTITEREYLAVVWAISKFRPYLYGAHFRNVTDRHALCWLATLEDPSGRLGHWCLKLQDYNFTVTYKSGK